MFLAPSEKANDLHAAEPQALLIGMLPDQHVGNDPNNARGGTG